MAKILLLEDDSVLAKNIKLSLELEGYSVFWTTDLKTGRLSANNQVADIYLLDWKLPDGTGLEWAREIRRYDKKVPIIFLTAREDEESAITTLDTGANDFIRKPFGTAELILRIKRTLRDTRRLIDELRFGELILEPETRRAYYREKLCHLSPSEFDILAQLVRAAGCIVSRELILQSSDSKSDVSNRVIDSHVSHLRRQLKKVDAQDLRIVAAYGTGYRIELVKIKSLAA